MKSKKVAFEIPYIGYDYGKENGWPFDVLIGTQGNPIIGISIRNAVEQYSADPESYIRFHTILNQIVATIGENRIVQKLDIFRKDIYHGEPSEHFLQQKYSEHFDGREFKTITTLLLFTPRTDVRRKTYKYTDQDYKDLRDKVGKVYMILDQHGLHPTYLRAENFEKILAGILTMKFSKVPSFDNITAGDEYLKIGGRFAKVISFVDVENIDLPSDMEPYNTLGGSGSAAQTAVDNFTFINELEDYTTVVYNQVISIPFQAQQQRDLEKKKKKHEGVAKNAPANQIIADEIEELLHNIAIDGQLIVEAHYSLAFSTESEEAMEKTQSVIENKLFTKGIIVSKNAYNQMELFRCCLPGNATELQDYDLFLTTSEAALCFFFKERYPLNEESPFFLRFTDRQGVPLKVDFNDLPMRTGRINNRNKFVLGPSGSGKSFLMNNIVEQYLTYNYDVVIVDTGDSYSGTCNYKGGQYIKYTEEKPITMNPFNVQKEEFNIEKVEFLSNLVFLIWQGADSAMTSTQKSILDKLLLSYYHEFYEGGTNWYKNKPTDELLLYLEQYNIHEDNIRDELEDFFAQEETYYDILGIPFNATTAEIKKTGRQLIRKYHPDKNTNNPSYDADLFYKVYEAYETLTDEKKRKVYNETHMLLAQSKEVRKRPNNTKEWEQEFRHSVIKRIQKIERDLSFKELSFNSFYEYSEKFLPLYLSNAKHPINQDEFNTRTFLLVLGDFYKGGRYDKTLNQNANESLFEESLIVFEIDNVKDNPKLFPIVTLIIMDTFLQKMRLRKDRRKAIIIEEAWKAIASKLMGGYILYLYKTVRKFLGEAIVVTQELNDIIGNAVVKDSIINNSDTFILLDQTKFKDNFDEISKILSLNKVEQNKIFTINNLNNKYGRSRFKEFYLKRGAVGEVYGNEVSLVQYLTYTTEKPEKVAIEYYVETTGSYDSALRSFTTDLSHFPDGINVMFSLINLYHAPLTTEVMEYYELIKKQNPKRNPLKVIEKTLRKESITLKEMLEQKSKQYETA